MWNSLLVGLAATVALAAAVPLDVPHALHERRHQAPKKWTKRDRVVSHAVLPVRIGMVQSNIDRTDELLMEVSRHDSPKYSQWYTPEEIIDLFAPSQDSINAVADWLASYGVSRDAISLSVNKQWVSVDMKVAELEELLRTEYYHYQHKATGKTTIACDEYHVPAKIQEHIDYITPGLKLLAGGKVTTPESKEKRSLEAISQKMSGPIIGGNITKSLMNLTDAELLTMCDSMITPPCVAALYNITQATRSRAGNEMGIFEEGDFYAPEDLALFFTTLAQNIPPTTEPILHGVDGGTAPGVVATGESDLDFSLAYPIIYPQQAILFQTDDLFYAEGIEGSGGFLNTFLDAIDGSYCTFKAFGEKGNSKIDPVYPDPNPAGYQGKLQCGAYKPTNVISISYGEQEDDLPTNYQRRQCAEFAKLGMQGSTIILASGDSGVAARSSDDGNADGCLGDGDVFSPDFPASCPYVSALGATFLPTGGDVYKDQEVAVTRFPSGGGFSNIYSRPSYQDNAVNGYFTKHNPTYPYYSLTTHTNNPTAAETGKGIYNRAGRGYPDFSAIGDNVVIFLDGTPMLIGGTSAAAPTFGAIINRINEERLHVGKKTVGFVNPTLYAHPQVFHDITVGNNSGCGTPGFYAGTGWDPVTGLGTPNYRAMLKLYMSLA